MITVVQKGIDIKRTSKRTVPLKGSNQEDLEENRAAETQGYQEHIKKTLRRTVLIKSSDIKRTPLSIITIIVLELTC